MLCKGDTVFDARFMCWEVIIFKTREWVTHLQLGKVAEDLGGCRTSHIIQLATHKHLLATKIVEILHNPQYEHYIMNRPFHQFPDAA
eukprot:15002090-Heterocapsa_arctica.AAC.1